MSRQVRQRLPKYVVARVITVEVPSEPEEEERHDSWVDSNTQIASVPAFHEEWYDEARMPTVSRAPIGFQRNERRTWT